MASHSQLKYRYLVGWYASSRHCAWQVGRVDVQGDLVGGDELGVCDVG